MTSIETRVVPVNFFPPKNDRLNDLLDLLNKTPGLTREQFFDLALEIFNNFSDYQDSAVNNSAARSAARAYILSSDYYDEDEINARADVLFTELKTHAIRKLDSPETWFTKMIRAFSTKSKDTRTCIM